MRNAADTSAAGDGVIVEMARSCVLMRARLIARVVTGIYDDALRPFGIGSPQFVLLVVVGNIGPATRADIGRYHRQDRSTLTRNLRIILSEGWAEEIADAAGGRGRPIVLTKPGRNLLRDAAPAWRAAQAKAKVLLGKDGSIAVAAVADRILTDRPSG